jgi:hypothetical protein
VQLGAVNGVVSADSIATAKCSRKKGYNVCLRSRNLVIWASS